MKDVCRRFLREEEGTAIKELNEKLCGAIGDCVEGIYVIEEKTKRIHYLNSFMDPDGTGTGQLCHHFFCGEESPCRFCPTLESDGTLYAWEYFNNKNHQTVLIKNRLVTVDEVEYRVGNINAVQELMSLTRSIVGEVHDLNEVIEQKRQEQAVLAWQSDHDKMTGLLNRGRFIRDNEQYFRNFDTAGVLFADINNLKQINDQQGHEYGDLLIEKTAQSLQSCGGDARVYRLGGDEFAAILGNIDRKTLEEFSRCFDQELERRNRESDPVCSVAVGLAWGGTPNGIDDLMREADVQMYARKRRQKNPFLE